MSLVRTELDTVTINLALGHADNESQDIVLQNDDESLKQPKINLYRSIDLCEIGYCDLRLIMIEQVTYVISVFLVSQKTWN